MASRRGVHRNVNEGYEFEALALRLRGALAGEPAALPGGVPVGSGGFRALHPHDAPSSAPSTWRSCASTPSPLAAEGVVRLDG